MKRKNEGEEYLDAFPKLRKWINECCACHQKGYDPNMPDKITVVEGSLEVYFIKKHFKPLPLNEDGLCEQCAHALLRKQNGDADKTNFDQFVRKPAIRKPKITESQHRNEVVELTEYSYEKVIEYLNNGKIKSLIFAVKDYPHYNHCEISYIDDRKTIMVKPVQDNSENVCFFKTFKENYKIFNMGRKGTFTLKQLWNKIDIKEINY